MSSTNSDKFAFPYFDTCDTRDFGDYPKTFRIFYKKDVVYGNKPYDPSDPQEYFSFQKIRQISHSIVNSATRCWLKNSHRPKKYIGGTVAASDDKSKCIVCLDVVSQKSCYQCSECKKAVCRKCYKNSIVNNYEAEFCLECNSLYMFNTLRFNRSFLGVQKRTAAASATTSSAAAKKKKTENGFVSTYIRCCDLEVLQEDDYKCGKCGKVYCEKCGQIKKREHKCNKDDLATANFLKASDSTKPCPKCKTLIERSYGCSHMFCISCRTSYDWETGSILKTSSNPLFQQYRNTMLDNNSLCDNMAMPHVDNNNLDIVRFVRDTESFIFSHDYRRNRSRSGIFYTYSMRRFSDIFTELIYTLLLQPLYAPIVELDNALNEYSRLRGSGGTDIDEGFFRILVNEQQELVPAEFLRYIRVLFDTSYRNKLNSRDFIQNYTAKHNALKRLITSICACENVHSTNIKIFCNLVRKYLVIFNLTDYDFYLFLNFHIPNHVNRFTELCVACVLQPDILLNDSPKYTLPEERIVHLSMDEPFLKKYDELNTELIDKYSHFYSARAVKDIFNIQR